MKTLFSMLAAAVLFLPAAASAQDISARTLQEHNIACVQKCNENKPPRFCQQVCECVTTDMSENWTAQDYRARSEALQKSVGDPTVETEFSEMAKACALRIQQQAGEK